MIKLKWHPECPHAVPFPITHHKAAATTLSVLHRQKRKQTLTHLCPFQKSLTSAFCCEAYCSDCMLLKSMAAQKGGKVKAPTWSMDTEESVSKFNPAFWATDMEKKKKLLDVGKSEKDQKSQCAKAHSHTISIK